MYNYLMKIEYDGTKYVGWQIQKNGSSIQEKIEKALKKTLRSKTKIIGAGRTDKGVHAYGQYANFKTQNLINESQVFLNSMNFFLKKESISITALTKKFINFHSRFSAKERIYKYIITNRIGSLSLDRDRTWHIKKKIDIKLLKKGAKILTGTHDFSTFRSSSCTAKSPIKKIKFIKVTKSKDRIILTFNSKSFLQNQVRSMVGCLKSLSTKEWDFQKFKKVFKSKNRKHCAAPAPAHGLYLYNVIY